MKNQENQRKPVDFDDGAFEDGFSLQVGGCEGDAQATIQRLEAWMAGGRETGNLLLGLPSVVLPAEETELFTRMPAIGAS